MRPYHPRVRDRDDVAVLRCEKSGVVFLSRSDHMGLAHYAGKAGFSTWGSAPDRERAALAGREDDERRAARFRHAIRGRRWLDVGTGAGGILDLLVPLASETRAVEPQPAAREALRACGYVVHPTLDEAQDGHAEVVTLFHVLEHLVEPVAALGTIRAKMAPGGELVVEVPHANDFLLSFLESEEFKAFTLWSEHLVLHTRRSLAAFLERAGFRDVAVTGCQRYPLANHLHWLARKRPGGHLAWKQLRTPELDAAYARMLDDLDMTDTLVATARR